MSTTTFLNPTIRIAKFQSNLDSINQSVEGGSNITSFMTKQNENFEFFKQVGEGAISVVDSFFTVTNPKTGEKNDFWPCTFAMTVDGSLYSLAYVRLLRSAWQEIAPEIMEMMDGEMEISIKDLPNHYRKFTFNDLLLDDSTSSDDESDPPPSLSYTYDGTEYTIFGAVTNTFVNGGTPWWEQTLNIGVDVASGIGALGLGVVGGKGFVVPCLKAYWQGQKEVYQMSGGYSVDSILSSGVEDTTLEVVDEGVELGFTAVGTVCFGLSLVVIAIPVILNAIEHASANNISIYNLSNNYDVVWEDPHLYNSTMAAGPVVDANATPVTYEKLIPGLRNTSPNKFIAGVSGYGGQCFGFTSSSDLAGTGQGFGLKFYDIDSSATTASDYDDAIPAFYGAWGSKIPFVSNNQIGCTFSADPISSDDYYNNENLHDTLSYSVSYTDPANNNVLNMNIGIDFKDGKHPDTNGNEGYNYNVVINITDGDNSAS